MKIVIKKVASIAFVATLAIAGYAVTKITTDKSNITTLSQNDIESLSDCESINGKKNDGHCVQNKDLVYFCAEAGLFQSYDCRQ